MRTFFSGLVLIFILQLTSHAQQVEETGSSGIWFKNTETLIQRFTYSQAVLWPSSIAGHIGLYIAKDDFDWSKAVRLDVYKRTFTEWPKIDHDHWSWNYEAHPYMGSLSYLAYRNKKSSIWLSAGGAALNSIIYEYIIAGGTQTPSWNDMIVTPIGGSILGEGLYQLKKLMLKDKHLTTFEKIVITICDPVDVFYFGFDYQKLINYKYR